MSPQLNVISKFLEPVILTISIETTRKLKYKSYFGHDGISSNILKHSITIIAVPITHIITRSIAISCPIEPNMLKLAILSLP